MLVLTLVLPYSVDERVLEVASNKLKLETTVMESAVYRWEDMNSTETDNLDNERLKALLSGTVAECRLAKSGEASSETLDLLLDRNFLLKGKPCPYPLEGVGYKVLSDRSGESGRVGEFV